MDTEERIGYWTMDIDGRKYWKLLYDPDGYQNDFVEDGDVYRPYRSG
jgi:hypothetical protein